MKLPINKNAETALLGILTSSPECIAECGEHLFQDPTNGMVFDTVRQLSEDGVRIDLIDFLSLRTALESKGLLEAIGGDSRVVEIVGLNLGKTSLSYYRDILETVSATRRYMVGAKNSIEEAEKMERPLCELIEELSVEAQVKTPITLPTIQQQCCELTEDLEQDLPPDRFPVGIPPLDHLIDGGVERKELFVVGAQTSRGKSLLLGQAGTSSADRGWKTAYFSLEMPAKSLLKRFISNVSGMQIKSKYERNGVKLEAVEVRSLMNGISRVSKYPMTIIDSISELDEILRAAAMIKRKGGLDVLVVDYIQRVEADGDHREQVVSTITRKLKNFAMTHNCAVFTASQLNDDGKLRESRAIGHEADVVMTIADEGADTIIHVDKFRRGQVGTSITVTRRGELGRFELKL